jgi:hypothetical protein
LGNQEAFYEEVELLRMGMFGHGKLIEMGIPGAWREDQRLRTSLEQTGLQLFIQSTWRSAAGGDAGCIGVTREGPGNLTLFREQK